jgi:hypothetical protein
MLIEVEVGVELELVTFVHADRIRAADGLANRLPDFAVRLYLFVPGAAIYDLGATHFLAINGDNCLDTTVVKMPNLLVLY